MYTCRRGPPARPAGPRLDCQHLPYLPNYLPLVKFSDRVRYHFTIILEYYVSAAGLHNTRGLLAYIILESRTYLYHYLKKCDQDVDPPSVPHLKAYGCTVRLYTYARTQLAPALAPVERSLAAPRRTGI